MASRLTNASLFAVIAVALALPSTAQTFEIERHVSEDSVHASALTRDVSRRFAEADRIQFIEDVRELGATSISVVLDIEWTPEGYLTDEEVAAQRERIAKAQAEVISELSRYGIAEDAFKYAYVPGMEVEFTEHTIPALDNVPVVSRLEVTAPAVPATPVSTERIEAPAIWERGGVLLTASAGLEQVLALFRWRHDHHPVYPSRFSSRLLWSDWMWPWNQNGRHHSCNNAIECYWRRSRCEASTYSDKYEH